MDFNPGFDITLHPTELSFEYGAGVCGPVVEFRTLDAIRPSLMEPNCSGPDPVYGIAMDVARAADMPELQKRMLLFGAVAYAGGRLGKEPVRSQGHVHAIAPHCGWSTPEWFEVWEGNAIIYAQECVTDDPGRCVAVSAGPGDQVIVPPGWAHCVINADPKKRMVFGALCDRQYGFVYDGVRQHHGLAWFPVFTADNAITWERNPRYTTSHLDAHQARAYPELNCDPNRTMYEQFRNDPESVHWVSEPQRVQTIWPAFIP